MGTTSVWNEDITASTYDTDFQSRWKPASFSKAMVTAATHHASSIGFPRESMFQQDMIWVLSRVKICFYRFPLVEERLSLRTWPKGIQQKLFFMRDFQFRDASGELIAAATTAWLLINTQARRILPPQALPGIVPDNDGMYALDEKLDKINVPGAGEECLRVAAGYSAVDLMGHVNNTRYIDWICDCFSFEQHRQQRIESLQINYVNEVKPGEEVSIAKMPGNAAGEWILPGMNQTTGARAFEAALIWSAGSES